MATIISKASKMKLVYSEEVDGKVLTRSKSFSNIDAEASDDAILQAGNALGDLQAHAPEEVRRVDELSLEPSP